MLSNLDSRHEILMIILNDKRARLFTSFFQILLKNWSMIYNTLLLSSLVLMICMRAIYKLGLIKEQTNVLN